MTPLVRLEGAARWFGAGHTEVVALHPTDLTVAAGELVAVMGPSGSGKTTLISLVGGLDRPSRGRVVVDGQDVGALDARALAILRRRVVGYVFQDLNLLAGLTALENVSLPLELDGRAPAEARAAAKAESNLIDDETREGVRDLLKSFGAWTRRVQSSADAAAVASSLSFMKTLLTPGPGDTHSGGNEIDQERARPAVGSGDSDTSRSVVGANLMPRSMPGASAGVGRFCSRPQPFDVNSLSVNHS